MEPTNGVYVYMCKITKYSDQDVMLCERGMVKLLAVGAGVLWNWSKYKMAQLDVHVWEWCNVKGQDRAECVWFGTDHLKL